LKEATVRHLFVLASLVLAALLGGPTACSSGEKASTDEFSNRLQGIGERGGEQWGRLAQEADDLEAGDPLSTEVRQALTELVTFQKQAESELAALTPPEGAEEAVALLVEALRERTETLEQVLEQGHFTPQTAERTTQAGEKIDRAFEDLRSEGFLASTDEHEDDE
jgi:hypothetical protein